MAIKFQYNKTSLGELDKQLKVRRKTLPTLKSKESALRTEVKKSKDISLEFRKKLDELYERFDYMVSLWSEFDPGLITVQDIVLEEGRIAGVRFPVLKEVIYEEKEYELFSSPLWFSEGILLLKEVASLILEYEVSLRKTELLEYARKKTTQKVNLYEKVQIPGFENAILKIRRFLEDEENLSKSAQKIVKNKHAKMEEEGV